MKRGKTNIRTTKGIVKKKRDTNNAYAVIALEPNAKSHIPIKATRVIVIKEKDITSKDEKYGFLHGRRSSSGIAVDNATGKYRTMRPKMFRIGDVLSIKQGKAYYPGRVISIRSHNTLQIQPDGVESPPEPE